MHKHAALDLDRELCREASWRGVPRSMLKRALQLVKKKKDGDANTDRGSTMAHVGPSMRDVAAVNHGFWREAELRDRQAAWLLRMLVEDEKGHYVAGARLGKDAEEMIFEAASCASGLSSLLQSIDVSQPIAPSHVSRSFIQKVLKELSQTRNQLLAASTKNEATCDLLGRLLAPIVMDPPAQNGDEASSPISDKSALPLHECAPAQQALEDLLLEAKRVLDAAIRSSDLAGRAGTEDDGTKPEQEKALTVEAGLVQDAEEVDDELEWEAIILEDQEGREEDPEDDYVDLRELLDEESLKQDAELEIQREAAKHSIRSRKAQKLQRAWRAHRAPLVIDPVAVMYLERLAKYAPSLMKTNGFCEVCNDIWDTDHEHQGHNHNVRAFRECFEAYYRATVIPLFVLLESLRRKLQAEDARDEKVASVLFEASLEIDRSETALMAALDDVEKTRNWSKLAELRTTVEFAEVSCVKAEKLIVRQNIDEPSHENMVPAEAQASPSAENDSENNMLHTEAEDEDEDEDILLERMARQTAAKRQAGRSNQWRKGKNKVGK